MSSNDGLSSREGPGGVRSRDLAARMADDGTWDNCQRLQGVDQRNLNGSAEGLRELCRRQSALLGWFLQFLFDRVLRLLSSHALQVLIERSNAGPECFVELQKLPTHLGPLCALTRENYDDVRLLRRLQVYRCRDAFNHAIVNDSERPVRQMLSPNGQSVCQIANFVWILRHPLLIILNQSCE